tara:strand:- start:129 stop:350 length:222 start_codon:yes stop_codon:yes gene_type:complete
MSKATASEIKAALKNMAEASYQEYGSYSYASGYYESMLVYLIEELPVTRQKSILSQIATTKARFSKEKEGEMV